MTDHVIARAGILDSNKKWDIGDWSQGRSGILEAGKKRDIGGRQEAGYWRQARSGILEAGKKRDIDLSIRQDRDICVMAAV